MITAESIDFFYRSDAVAKELIEFNTLLKPLFVCFTYVDFHIRGIHRSHGNCIR